MSEEIEHTIHEAAELLGWAATTLRDKCTQQAVPHHRRHAASGIYFTDEDITEIKAMRRRRPAASPTEIQATPGMDTATPTEVPAAPGTNIEASEDSAMEAALGALAPSTRTRR